MQGARTFHLTLSSVAGAKFEGAVTSATFPGSAGEMTVLPGHEPLVTTLKAGTITVHPESGDAQFFEIDKGVMECADSRVTVLL